VRKRWPLPPFLLILLVCGYHWRLVFSSEFTWLEAPGVYEHTLPSMQFQAGEIHRLALPLWDPYTDSGRPLIGFGKPSALYPPHLAMLSMPLKNGWLAQNVLHWYFVLIQCAMALTMYAFARSLGQSSPAAVLAGCVYALTIASSEPHVLHACVWVPLVFRSVFRGDAAAAGLFLGLCWLPGSLEIPLFATIGAIVFALFRRLGWASVAAILALSLAIGSVSILPGLQMARIGTPPALGTPTLVAIALAILGFASVAGPARSMACIAAIGLAAAPFGGSVLFSLGIAAGSGWGAQLPGERWCRRIGVALTAAGALTLYYSAIAWMVRWKIVEDNGSLVLGGFLALALALLFWKGQPRNAATTALVLLLLDLSQISFPHWQSRFEKERPRKLTTLIRDRDIASYLTDQRKYLPRVTLDSTAIDYDFGSWWGVETHRLDPRFRATYWVSRQPRAEFQTVVFEGHSGIHVYRSNHRHARELTKPPCGGHADILRRSVNGIELDVEAECDGLVVTGIYTAPGWVATVDGKTVSPQSFEGDLQGIPVTRGHHQVKARFQPISLIAGSCVSGIGLILAIILARRQPNKL